MVKGNAIVIHGGGLVDPSKSILMRLAGKLAGKGVYEKIYIGKYSFEALYTPEFWLEYNGDLQGEVANKRGGYFGTCRGIDLTNPRFFERALECLRRRNVTTIIVTGGDGSSRHVAEIYESFEKYGINIIFAIPLTIDGINGGEAIGMVQAVREGIHQTENIVSTSLETRDNGEYGVVVVELQGRNRDDIMANVLAHFHEEGKVADISLENIFMAAIPATMETNEEVLISKINSSSKRTLILLSEGASIDVEKLKKKITRKVRVLVVGHQAQSNGQTTTTDMVYYNEWIDKVSCLIEYNPKKSFSIAKREGKHIWSVEDIDYYAKLNPKKDQKAELSKELNVLLKMYMS